MSGTKLSFYDHARQTYHHLPIREDRAVAEFLVGDYGKPGDDQGVGEGGEFAIYLYRLNEPLWQSPQKPLSVKVQVFHDAFGSLREFIACGALDLIEKSEIWSNDDLTAVLLGAGLYDRSDYVAKPGACQCCDGSGYAEGVRAVASDNNQEGEQHV